MIYRSAVLYRLSRYVWYQRAAIGVFAMPSELVGTNASRRVVI